MSPAGSGKAQFRGGLGAYVGTHPRPKWLWPVFAWLLGLGLVVGSGLLPPAAGYMVIVGACVFLGFVLGGRTGEPSGLRHHRQ
jgi:hypothetical protein